MSKDLQNQARWKELRRELAYWEYEAAMAEERDKINKDDLKEWQ